MTDDDGGVLGNLPRSRPGQRSDKRTAAKAAERGDAAQPKQTTPRKTATRPRTSAPRQQPAAPRQQREASPRQREAPRRRPSSHAGDPVGDAIRTVTGVAATGARVAGGVAREVLRRLPRP